uniref:Transmembrane protein n=1 Tax=Nelumbo nucifera TaxID=4432 RepID=A0A822XN51_NELNU|nr:TPA_asm: hypothetical protein HUJ06_022935 [Nelumbo nucifera]
MISLSSQDLDLFAFLVLALMWTPMMLVAEQRALRIERRQIQRRKRQRNDLPSSQSTG